MELFWDESDRLIDTVITHASPVSGVTIVRWHYHYVGGTLIAASRELSTPPVAPATKPTIAVKRFWVVSDERGLPHRLLDEQGAEYWKATWDASGWRTIQTQAAEMLWVPFGLPGQLVLRDTDAYASGTESGATVTRYRAPIILNQWRAYDALTGTYLQPDGADVMARGGPEGYAYARNSPISTTDRTGATSTAMQAFLWFFFETDSSCDYMRKELLTAVNQAMDDIQECKSWNCGAGSGADNFRRQWIFSLLTTATYCARSTQPVRLPDGSEFSVWGSGVKPEWTGSLIHNNEGTTAFTRPGASNFLHDRITVVGETFYNTCLARVLAHEAAHGVFATLPYDAFHNDSEFNRKCSPWPV